MIRINRYIKRLDRLAQEYRVAEEQIVGAFFKRSRTKAEHFRWLKAQAFKEYSAIRPIFTALAKLYPQLDREIDRHDFEKLTEKLADETKHARLVMDLLEKLSGKRVTFADLFWLSEDQKLAKIRSRFSKSYATLLHGNGVIRAKEIRRKDEGIERAAITLTEGGGGALYRICSKLKSTGVEEKIALVFKEILADETEHKNAGVKSLASLVKSRAAFERAAGIIRVISSQRLRMRNQQFGFPLTEAQLKILNRRARAAARL